MTLLQRSSARRRWAGRLLRASGAKGAFLTLAPVLSLALLAVFLSGDPQQTDANAVLSAPTLDHPFGTDQLGRDQLARVASAIPLAFVAPMSAVALALLVGGSLGIFAGYARGVVERFIMWLMDILLGVPALLLAIIVVGVFGGGLRNTVIAIGVMYIPHFARMARGATLSVRDQPYVDAARLANVSPLRIVLGHVVPNVKSALTVLSALTLSTALMAQSALSFLGLGIIPPDADLGNMLASSVEFIDAAPWLLAFPAVVLVLLILGFNFLGDCIGELSDPTLDRVDRRIKFR